MTSKERVLAAMHRQPVDHVPCAPLINFQPEDQRWGRRWQFPFGPSDTIHLPYEKPDEVRQAVRMVFEVFGRTGLILTPVSSAKAVFPWENVLAMVDEWKRWR